MWSRLEADFCQIPWEPGDTKSPRELVLPGDGWPLVLSRISHSLANGCSWKGRGNLVILLRRDSHLSESNFPEKIVLSSLLPILTAAKG